MRLNRRAALLAAPSLLAAPRALHAQAPAWPAARPIEVIVPFPPGGGVDVMTRLILPLVQARIPGATFVVINRAGAAGQLGLEATFNAAPDGYTLGATSIPAQSAIPIERPTRYRALDFTFVANIVDDPNAIFVRTESPFRSIADVLAAAKAKPETLTYGTTGVGSDDHIFMLGLEQAARVPPMVHVPFAGAAVLTPQLLGGHLDMAVGNAGEAAVLARDGKVRGLVVAAEQRFPALPDMPTCRELGFDLVSSASRGILGPPGIPRGIAERLEQAFAGAMADPGFVAEATRLVMPLRPLTGAGYRAMAVAVDEQLQALWRTRPWKG